MYDAQLLSDLWLCNDFCSSNRICNSTQCYTGMGGESDCYLYTLGVLWTFPGEQWKVSNSENDAVISHEGQGQQEKPGRQCILLEAVRSCTSLQYCTWQEKKRGQQQIFHKPFISCWAPSAQWHGRYWRPVAISSTGPASSADSFSVTLWAREGPLFTSSDPFLFFYSGDGLGALQNHWDSGLKCIFSVFVIILIKHTTARVIWKQASHLVSLILWISVFATAIWSSFGICKKWYCNQHNINISRRQYS